MKENYQFLSSIKTKKDLVQMQRFFANKIRTPLLKGDKIKKDHLINLLILSNDRTSSNGRLQFYARQYWWRIISSFDEDFKTCQLLSSNSQYIKIRNDFLKNYPSKSFTLRHLGSRFPSYLVKSKAISGKQKKLFIDAAKYDYSIIESFESAAYNPITKSDIKYPKFTTTTLKLQPHIKLLSLDFPVHKIRKINQTIKDLSSNTNALKTLKSRKHKHINIKKEKTYLAIHRLEGRTYSKELTKYEFEILKLFKQGLSIEKCNKKILSIKNIDHALFINDFYKSIMSLSWLYKNGAKRISYDY